MILSEKELKQIEGGAFKITASFLNAISRGIETFLNLGRMIGSTIRRIGAKNLCPIS